MTLARVNGTDLFYIEAGSGPACLVLHGGLGFDHTYLHPWLDPLGDVFGLVYYDHRGNGRSGRPPLETLTFAQFCDDANALRELLDVEKVAVMGHSYGGFIALEYALRYPGRLSHLVLVDTAPAFKNVDEVFANAERKGTDEMMEVLRAPSPEEDAELMRMMRVIAPLYFRRFDEELSDRMMADTIVSASAGMRGEELLAEYDVTSRLGEIRAPTLVLVGRDDFICPPSQAAIMHEGIAGSELVVFEESGHFPWVEEPDAFFGAIRDWLGRTAVSQRMKSE